jgi:DNA-binding beta-propeller fold protein YncE
MRKILIVTGLGALLLTVSSCTTTGGQPENVEDLYAEYVWPPPPDQARIRLINVIRGRADIELDKRLDKILFGASPQQRFDWLKKPTAVEYDHQGRILVTDTELRAVLRFDIKGKRVDVLGTKGSMVLAVPLGMDVGPDGTLYVADGGLKKIVAIDTEGKIAGVYGRQGELSNPTDVAVSPAGTELYVTDSKAHKITVINIESGDVVSSFGESGIGEVEFNYPTALTFTIDGDLLVVDALNARVQLLTTEGEFLDQLGGRGVGFGSFVRPKDIAQDERGFIYVPDAAFNNLQLFDSDFTLLTFVGRGGKGPGQFTTPSGIAVRGNEFAVVDQIGHRLQIFRLLDID